MIKKTEDVLSALEVYKTQGFDRIHIPGGTSKDGKFYAGGFVFYHDRGEKQIYFVGIPYNSNFYKTEDVNGHTKKLGEKPVNTVRREIQEETGLLTEIEDFILIDSYSIPSKNGTEGEKHEKYFYLTSKFRGQLFDFEGKPNPIDNETGSPIWIPLPIFAEVLFGKNDKGLIFGHRKALEKVLQHMMVDKDLFFIIEKAGLAK